MKEVILYSISFLGGALTTLAARKNHREDHELATVASAAEHWYKIAEETKEELKALKTEHSKLHIKYDELVQELKSIKWALFTKGVELNEKDLGTEQ